MCLKASRLEEVVLMHGKAEIKNFCPVSQYTNMEAEGTVGSKEHLHQQFQPKLFDAGKVMTERVVSESNVVCQRRGDNHAMFIYFPHWRQPLFPALAWNSPLLKMMPFGIISNPRFSSAVFLLRVNQALLFLRKELHCCSEGLWVISWYPGEPPGMDWCRFCRKSQMHLSSPTKKKCVFIEKSNNAEAPDAPNTGPDGASKYKCCRELCSHLLYPASERVNQPQAAELSTSPRLAWCKLFQRSRLKVLRKPKAEFLASTEPVEVFREEGDKLRFKSVLDWREESFP